MFCPECGTENKANANFCEQCGLTLTTKPTVATSGKPLGIVIISILAVFGGLASIALGIVAAAVPDLIGLVAAVTGKEIDAAAHIVSLKLAGFAAAGVASGILSLAMAYGLWNFIGWGRVLAVLIHAVGLFVGIILFFTNLNATQTAGTIAIQLFSFAVAIGILIYLFRPHIRELFHGPGIPTPSLAANMGGTAVRSSAPR